MADLVGPPAPRSKFDNLPREMQAEDEKTIERRDLLTALLALAGVSDLYMTDQNVGKPGDHLLTPQERIKHQGLDPNTAYAYTVEEGNPLPGMQSSAGRLAWGAAEQKGLQELRQRKPAVGIPVSLAAALTHLILAGKWHTDTTGPRK